MGMKALKSLRERPIMHVINSNQRGKLIFSFTFIFNAKYKVGNTKYK